MKTQNLKQQDKMNEVQMQLKMAQELIRDPAHWCQGSLHRSKIGERLDERAPERAAQHCAMGATYWVSPDYTLSSGERPMYRPLLNAAMQMGFEDVACVNDCTDHPTVMKMFDLAIKLAGERQ